ncbi:SEC14-like protein 2 isoform X1 [Bombus vancouverensis nearcticus]|uniref:SEC14-like protein 2 isoform X1 n=2 Tax=Bombus bifarius TaxID=103933 RepID=A0A6P8MJA7_9HYME|nr:SEC14-like protein 2 isoform X1 [Bombus vancouverensis nearcticus]XP_033185045.1 SEC14-like protein 2 isoform X1 [Bombus vancouverensis nearcticus]XP_033302750.1 SEC14-like protein 2 isoform X1 [Bombus bifarius]XP_050473279.1 SEC14-like protein 2 isoform X1 [Bombus huntii]XP_050473280.1 SEC14-like protein 2 isoform X1 [Bombus huntii]XP_050473282.1 SEC14-like protein 2 isoform X1 [Bombus huntii]
MLKVVGLEDNQRFALMKFRRTVQDILKQPHHDDNFLLRWLRARKWDPVAAEKMLRESMEWRKQWEVDKLTEWDPPQILNDYLPHGLCGFDKDGAPVIVVYFDALDIYGILHVVSRRDMIKVTIKRLEEYLKLCREQMLKHGPAAGQVVVIFDMQGFNLKQYLWRPAGEVVITLIQMYEANYPEILKTCYIINAPKVFAFAFSVTKKFMNEYTLSKIQIYKSDPARWQTAIFSNIDRDQVPAFFGGTLKDPDGNPKLGTKICLGGKVPKEMYVNNTEKDMENFTTVTIKKGGKLELDIPASEMGSLLSWEFRTENHDIRFGIVKKDYNGTQKEVIPMRRVAAHQLDEIGILTCEVPSTYSIIFDNTYSIIRNKKIHYSVKVIPPTESQEITPTTL